MVFGLEFSSEKAQAETYVNLQKWHMKSVIIWIINAIIVIAFSCFWSNISGKATDYTDPSTQWQACFTQAQYVTIPLNATLTPVFNQVAAAKTEFASCILGLVSTTSECSSNDGISCILDIQSDCTPATAAFPTVDDAQLPVGQILNSLGYIGIQGLIFSAIGIASLHRAFTHPTWLPSSIALLIWDILAIFTYYTVNPILPVPNQTNATLMTLLIYGSSKAKYDNLNDGDNQCDIAFNYLWVYLFFLLIIATITLLNLFIAILAEVIKIKDQHRKPYESLKNTEYPCILAVLAALFYIIILVAKAYGSNVALDSIFDFNLSIKQAVAQGYRLWFPQVWFPFSQPGLDISTILYLVSFMSIVRGYTIQSVSAFRLSFGTALVFSLASYAPVVGGLQFYINNSFYNYADCYNYFLTGSNNAYFGYPDLEQSKHYCNSFRLAISGSLGLFITLHGITIASYFTFYRNSDRQSMVIEEFQPELYDIKPPLGFGGSRPPTLTGADPAMTAKLLGP